MKRLFVCIAALGFLAGAPALSEDNNHRGDDRTVAAPDAARGPADARKNEHGPGMAHQNAKSDARSSPNGGPAAGTPANRYHPTSGDVRPNRPGRPTVDRTRNNSGWSGRGEHQQPVVNRPNSGWTGNTTARNNNREALQRNMQASRRFHGGTYVTPQGYQHRHWSYGERLPRLYYARNYRINNLAMFGLFAPPSGLVWVRVGDDALLIDRYSGEIVQVQYGFFY